jgi:hypothetical protein
MPDRPAVFYDFACAPGVRLRDDHDGQPLVLAAGVDDNGTGEVLDVAVLARHGVILLQPPDPEALADALEAHIGDLADSTRADLTMLCQVSPTVATNVRHALNRNPAGGQVLDFDEQRDLLWPALAGLVDDRTGEPALGTADKALIVGAAIEALDKAGVALVRIGP